MRYRMLFVVFLLSSGSVLAQSSEPPVEELKRLVEQKERELVEAQVAVASARARLAKAEGKLDLAASEWRKVLAHREGQLKSFQEEIARGRICYPDTREAEANVVIARVSLAEVENRPDILLVELPKVVAFYEGQSRRIETLRCRNAISEKEARDSLKEFGEELRLAKDRLASLQARR
jgi:hypothetical protein